jgi:hypothetical protein
MTLEQFARYRSADGRYADVPWRNQAERWRDGAGVDWVRVAVTEQGYRCAAHASAELAEYSGVGLPGVQVRVVLQ